MLEVAERVRDPAGEGREYIVKRVSGRKKKYKDQVGWGSEHEWGHVKFMTSYGAAGVSIVEEPS